MRAPRGAHYRGGCAGGVGVTRPPIPSLIAFAIGLASAAAAQPGILKWTSGTGSSVTSSSRPGWWSLCTGTNATGYGRLESVQASKAFAAVVQLHGKLEPSQDATARVGLGEESGDTAYFNASSVYPAWSVCVFESKRRELRCVASKQPVDESEVTFSVKVLDGRIVFEINGTIVHEEPCSAAPDVCRGGRHASASIEKSSGTTAKMLQIRFLEPEKPQRVALR